ncbi:MAG: hypothetical protein HQK50_09185 [Oligoflexia bacterium]|nr:hypothetical protein [Oligoflexia bacterium]MBF0365733.1 hypothetical protein [Oligoflexia bacterium]
MKYFLLFAYLYALFSTIFTAGTFGTPQDEWYYRHVGKIYWQSKDFSLNPEHPPLAKLLGASLPVLLGKDNQIYYRLMHLLLYVAAGVALSLFFYFRKQYWATFIFCLLYFFNPNIKAIASLDVNDFLVSLLVATSAFFIYYGRWPFAAVLSLGFALSTKFTALFYLPFLLLALFCGRSFSNFGKILQTTFTLILGIALPLSASYLFEWSELKHFWEGFCFQLHHNQSGHPTYLFGNFSKHGFWYFYLLVYFFKTSLPMHLLILATLGGYFLKQRPFRLKLLLSPILLYFLIPALSLLLVLSKMDVQIGYRYLLPAVLLLIVACTLMAAEWLQQKRINTLIAILFCFLVVAEDLYQLLNSNYLSYFNQLLLSPATRSFADSNIDWGQDIPRHLLRERYSYSEPLPLDLTNVCTNPRQKEHYFFRIGASELVGIWGNPLASQFMQLKPFATVAGHEIFKLTQAEVSSILCKSGWEKIRPITW